MRRTLVPIVVVVVLAVVLAAPVPAPAQQAGQQPQPGEKKPAGQQEQAQPQMTPEQAAMMAAWEKSMSPGPEHRRLADMTGDFTFTARYWMQPGAPPQESTGTASSEMILGGRYAFARAEGRMMDMDFKGMGFTGFDNVKGKYVSVWIDNMGTGMLVSEGSWEEATSSLVLEGDYADPMSGQNKHMKMVTKVVSKDRHVDEFWEAGPDGTPVKTMEIEYRRK